MPKASNPAESNQGEKKLRGPDKVGRAKSRTLTAIEFEGVRPLLHVGRGLSDDRIEAARLAMVEGKKFTDIAEQFGWKSRQAVDKAVSIVWERFQRYQESQEAVAQASAALGRKKPAKQKVGQ